MLQKCQGNTMVADLKEANRLTKEIMATADVEIRILPMGNDFTVMVWGDSALYNAWAEPLETDAELRLERGKKVFSQQGALVGLVRKEDLDKVEEVPVSILDWRTSASKRVVHSTFCAESSALATALGRGRFVAALIAEMYHGGEGFQPSCVPQSCVEVRCMTDARSLYDHILAAGKLPEDRNEALYIAELRQMLCAEQSGSVRSSAQEEKASLHWIPSRCMLADGLTKPGLTRQMRDTLSRGVCRLHEVSAQSLARKAKRG
jgi:hypothetical protein